jgi:endonuclease/exonuclease/phosphatase family metal-dependent hydrolase
VRQDSNSVVPLVASARSIIASRYITISCTINGTQQEFSSIYLSAQAPARKAQLHGIIKSKISKEHAISGGDFNCVENTDVDIRYPEKGGTPTYVNVGGKTLARAIADSGLVDAFRLIHGDSKGGHSRQAHTIHTRIDRIYTKPYDSIWRWQKIGSPLDIFTGAAHSDHLPVIAKLALAKERPPSVTEAKINPAVFDNPNTRTITSLL